MNVRFSTRAASTSLASAWRSPGDRDDSSYFSLTGARRALISCKCERSGITAATAKNAVAASNGNGFIDFYFSDGFLTLARYLLLSRQREKHEHQTQVYFAGGTGLNRLVRRCTH